MEKTLTILTPKKGTDLEALWKYWSEKRAPRLVEQPAVLKYSIHRTRGISAPPFTRDDGTARGIWGVEEIYYNLESESFQGWWSAFNAVPEIKKEAAEWYTKFEWYTTLLVHEHPMMDRTICDPPGAIGIKNIAFHVPNPGLDVAKVWNFWKHTHGARHFYPTDTPQIRKYAISRVKQVLEGDSQGNWGFAELWQSHPTVESYLERMAKTDADPERLKWVTEWHSQFTWSPTIICEERIIIDRT